MKIIDQLPALTTVAPGSKATLQVPTGPTYEGISAGIGGASSVLSSAVGGDWLGMGLKLLGIGGTSTVAEDEAQEFNFMLSAGDDFRLEHGRFKTIEVSHADIISQSVEVIRRDRP